MRNSTEATFWQHVAVIQKPSDQCCLFLGRRVKSADTPRHCRIPHVAQKFFQYNCALYYKQYIL